MSEYLVQRWKSVVPRIPAIAPGYAYDLPALPSEIRDIERALGRPLPKLLRELLGCSKCWQWRDEEYDVVFSPPDQIIRDTVQSEDEDGEIVVSVSLSSAVKPYFYSSQRLCFAYSDYLRFQVDDDPSIDGSAGQIVVTDHDEEAIDLVAGSLDEFVDHGLSRLERVLKEGRYPGGI